MWLSLGVMEKVLSVLKIIDLARNFTILLVDDPGSRKYYTCLIKSLNS